jgi:hypothetical protein
VKISRITIDSNNSFKKSKFLNKFKISIILILFFVLIALIVAMNLSSKDVISYMKLRGFQGPAFSTSPTKYLKSIPSEFISSKFQNHKLDEMRIDIDFVEWEKLTSYKNNAINKGIIGNEEKKYIDASVSFKGLTRKVKLRLKGDWTDHLIGDKWSFRIKVKKGKYINGLKEMSIQNPQTRDFQGQILINEMLRDSNIIVPRYDFINVTVNGNDIGIMALTEHFTKELLENANRKESVIIKFDESDLWKARQNNQTLRQNQNLSKIISFKEARVRNNEVLSQHEKIAVGLLKGYLSGNLLAEDVFDVKLMGDFLAIHDLWGDTHSMVWHNLRFYYNPITAKLEPIAFDELLYHPSFGIPRSGFVSRQNNSVITLVYLNKLKELKDQIGDEYIQKYYDLDDRYESILREEFWLKPPKIVNQQKLEKRVNFLISQLGSVVHKKDNNSGWVVNLTDRSKMVNLLIKNESKNNTLIKSDNYVGEFYKYGLNTLGLDSPFHGYKSTSKKGSKLEVNEIDSFIEPIIKVDLDNYYKLIDVYFIDDSGSILEVQNYTPHTFKLNNISVVQNLNNVEKVSKINLTDKNIFFEPLSDKNKIDTKKMNLKVLNEFKEIKGLTLDISLLGDDISYIIQAKNYYDALHSHPMPSSSVEAQLEIHKFLTVDEPNKIISVKQGTWLVEEPIVVPNGYTLSSKHGVTLLFSNQSYIFSHGRIHFIGTKESPIKLLSQNTNEYWKGIKILGSPDLEESLFNHVKIRNTTSLEVNGWLIDAGFFAHNVNLKMNNISFANNNCEDAINLVNSKFSINEITVKNTVSDAFDSDYSNGTITLGNFSDIGHVGGGDGLDFSGSKVSLTNFSLLDIDDKAISVGERSEINASNINISNVSVGVAVKDGSNLNINDSKIDSAKLVAIMAYIKKPPYGGAEINADNVKIVNTLKKAKSGENSSIILNKNIIEKEKINVEELYNSIMKSGLK